jgi:putative CRISPR-associated protein (TIGR02619 family)
MPPPNVLLSTVGTSLWQNLEALQGKTPAEPLAAAFAARDWSDLAERLAQRDPAERTQGAEVNSVAGILAKGFAAPGCALYLLHSDTDKGRAIADVLVHTFRRRGRQPVTAVAVADLQDDDPYRFRTRGLRELVRRLCAILRDHSPAACAINATGGYKAQIAVAVLIGQALGVPVYYKHELFNEVIAFPPLPVALDFELWMKASGFLYALARRNDLARADEFAEGWDERYESLIERERIDGVEYLALSAAGQIFHETFRDRFRSVRDQVLPPAVPTGQKRPPKCDHGHLPALPGLQPFLERLTREVPQVVGCRTHYHNPDLPRPLGFRLSGGEVEGTWSDGKQTVKFIVDTRANTDGQRAAIQPSPIGTRVRDTGAARCPSR